MRGPVVPERDPKAESPTLVGFVEFDLAAFGAQDVPLGSVPIETDVGDVDVSDLFAGEPLSRFVIEASPPGTGDGQQVGFVSFLVPEPGGGPSALAALASVAALGCLARHRRARAASQSPVARVSRLRPTGCFSAARSRVPPP